MQHLPQKGYVTIMNTFLSDWLRRQPVPEDAGEAKSRTKIAFNFQVRSINVTPESI